MGTAVVEGGEAVLVGGESSGGRGREWGFMEEREFKQLGGNRVEENEEEEMGKIETRH